ncbi:MAG: glycosyltransferase [Planctomycetota bacterium]
MSISETPTAVCEPTPVLSIEDGLPATAGPERPLTRVLHVINGEHYSGAERVQDLLAEHLLPHGYQVGFACVKTGRFPDARHYQSAPIYDARMRSRLDLQCVQRLSRLIQEQRYQLVHAHTPRSLLVGRIAAGKVGVPLVYHVHSPTVNDSTQRLRNLLNHRAERWSLGGVARIVAVSPSLRNHTIACGSPAERVCYIANGVPCSPQRSTEPPLGTWTLGMVALFRPRKGVEVLLEALANLVSRGRDVRLLAVGPFESEEYQTEVLALADQLGIAERIEWTGFVGDVGEQLRRMDLFALPSLFGEGLPMVVLEAMAAGVPVVASRVEGIPEAIQDREQGLLVEPNDPAQLAAAVDEVVGGGLNYAALSGSAVERHRERFSAEAMAAQVAAVYAELLAKRRA